MNGLPVGEISVDRGGSGNASVSLFAQKKEGIHPSRCNHRQV